MKGPYQIKREHDAGDKYYMHRLINTRDGDRVVTSRLTKQPVAPLNMRKLQARLNTNALLGSF